MPLPGRMKGFKEVYTAKNVSDIAIACDRIFSDDSIKEKQLQTAAWFEGAGNQSGREW